LKKEENASKYKIVINLFMELKNSNPNGCNVIINNILYTYLFIFQKYLKLSKIDDFEVYLRVEISQLTANYQQTKTPITFISLIKME